MTIAGTLEISWPDLAKRVELTLQGHSRDFMGLVVVEGDAGSIRVSGHLPSPDLRQAAILVASHVAGVRHVSNQIVVTRGRRKPR